jgi:hypothetical protein
MQRNADDIFTCSYCGGFNIIADKSGFVCTDRKCGATMDFGCMLMAGNTVNVLDGFIREVKKGTYKHIFYWNERMAQFRMEEPLICEDHVIRLADSFDQLVRDGKITIGTFGIEKEQVKMVIVHAGLKTSKYLEKYLSISYILTGIMPYKEKPSFELINRMTEDFATLVGLFLMNSRFGRHSMISYNLIIRKLLSRHGGEEYIHCFPVLKTPSKRNKVMDIYQNMWLQILESEIISTLGRMLLKEKKLEDAQVDKTEIAPRITTKSHLKRRYTNLGVGHPAKRRRLY